jgi:hypothetical protein
MKQELSNYFDEVDHMYIDENHQLQIYKEVKAREKKERRIRLINRIIIFIEALIITTIIVTAISVILFFCFGL